VTQPPGNGPFATREQAEAEFAAFRQLAELGVSGPPGEQIVVAPGQFLTETIADTIEYWAPLGDYDREVITRLAGLLDAVEAGVVCSWIYRVMQDQYDNPATSKETDTR
jgi:hypothetical protein